MESAGREVARLHTAMEPKLDLLVSVSTRGKLSSSLNLGELLLQHERDIIATGSKHVPHQERPCNVADALR